MNVESIKKEIADLHLAKLDLIHEAMQAFQSRSYSEMERCESRLRNVNSDIVRLTAMLPKGQQGSIIADLFA